MGVHRRPAHPSVQESAQVFDDLKKDQRPLGQIGFDEKTVLRFAAVGDANRAAAGDHRRVLEERRDDQHQTVPLQDRIGIHPADPGVMRDVDPGVDGIAPPALFLVDDPQAWIDGEHFQSAVGRAVVHHDDLVLRVMLLQRVQRSQDVGLLVARGNHDADGRCEAAEQVREPGHVAALHVACDAAERADDQHGVHGIQRQEVQQKEPLGSEKERHHRPAPIRIRPVGDRSVGDRSVPGCPGGAPSAMAWLRMSLA